jgi:hypothetical protein
MGAYGDKMRKVIFSLILLSFILVFLPGIAGAFEDSVERYSSYTDIWTYNNGGYSGQTITQEYNSLYGTNNLKFYINSGLQDSYIITKNNVTGVHYFSFITRDCTVASDTIVYVDMVNSSGVTIAEVPSLGIKSNTKYEIVWDNTNIYSYENGTLKYTRSSTWENSIKIKLKFVGQSLNSPALRLDDFTTASIIGIPEVITEANSNIYFSWSSPYVKTYPVNYTISLYSLTNTNNAGNIYQWNIGNSTEWGFLNSSRSSLIGTNFGLYMLEMTRGTDVLTDQYFYYDQLSDPKGFPEILFQGGSSVKTDIRDYENNGGVVESGEEVYLYPAINASGEYFFTYDIQETPNEISTSLNTVYNTSSISSLTASYTGLPSQSYTIKVDGNTIGTTEGQATYSYTFSGSSVATPHIISFSLDFTVPGVWGEIKDSITQDGIKSATVTITGTNFSKTIYTDDNGIYYNTEGMTAGNTYTVAVTRAGYTTPTTQTITTTNSSTTRQDFYLDSLSSTQGAGLYYATHDVSFTVLPFWYSHIGVPGAEYTVTDNNGTITAAGYTDTKGKFAIEDMHAGTNYTFELKYNGTNHTEYIMPSETQYNIVLNNQTEIIHQYYNSWLSLNYTENNRSIAISYVSNKSIAAATATLKYSNGTIADTQNLNTQTGTFNFNNLPAANDYIINFNITASDNEKASQSWVLSAFQKVPLFPDNYPSWLKNTLFVAIILVFMLAFGKSKNDIACLAAAVLTSLGEFFGWLECSYYFVVLVWIIALGAVYLHYKRTGALG